MEGTVNWAKREDTRGLTGGTTAGGATLGAGVGTAGTAEARAEDEVFRRGAGLIEALAGALTVGLAMTWIFGLTGGASALVAFGVGCFATAAFLATGLAMVFELGAGLALTAVLTDALRGGLAVGLTLTTGLVLAATLEAGLATGFAADLATGLAAALVLTTGLLIGLALTADLATGFTTGFLEASGLDDFTTALPAAGLGTDLAAALLMGLALVALVALVLAATGLALVDTGIFPVLIVKSCFFAGYEQALTSQHLQL